MTDSDLNKYIRSISVNIPNELKDEYPFSLAAVKDLHELDLNARVNFFIGENGSGKSTLLEAVAAAYGFNPEGGSRNFMFETKKTHSILSEYLTITNDNNNQCNLPHMFKLQHK